MMVVMIAAHILDIHQLLLRLLARILSLMARLLVLVTAPLVKALPINAAIKAMIIDQPRSRW